MRTQLVLAAAACALAGLTAVAAAQPAQKITIGIYAPSVEFGAAQARLAYVQGLARAIEQATGVKTEAQSYANVAALKKDAVDFAIIDGMCYATNLGAMEGLGGNPPESLVNLGILYDQLGRPREAFDAWSKAKARGVQVRDLQRWIDAKKRIYGF